VRPCLKKSNQKKKASFSAAGSCPQAQNDLIWNIKDELKKACSTNDLKELLIFNKQQVPSGESAVSCPVSRDIPQRALDTSWW
jgi:poly [ADP-ribose] polymerase